MSTLVTLNLLLWKYSPEGCSITFLTVGTFVQRYLIFPHFHCFPSLVIHCQPSIPSQYASPWREQILSAHFFFCCCFFVCLFCFCIDFFPLMLLKTFLLLLPIYIKVIWTLAVASSFWTSFNPHEFSVNSQDCLSCWVIHHRLCTLAGLFTC